MSDRQDREQGPPVPQSEQGPPAGQIDIAQLAEKVYRLLQEDLRLEQARGARQQPRKGR